MNGIRANQQRVAGEMADVKRQDDDGSDETVPKPVAGSIQGVNYEIPAKVARNFLLSPGVGIKLWISIGFNGSLIVSKFFFPHPNRYSFSAFSRKMWRANQPGVGLGQVALVDLIRQDAGQRRGARASSEP